MEVPELPEDADESPPSGDGDASARRWLQIASNIATLIVAVSAIVLAIWEGMEMRRHNRLSVLPNLNASMRSERITGQEAGRPDSVHRLVYSMENTGLGPAVFKKVLIFRRGADPGATPVAQTTEDGDFLNANRGFVGGDPRDSLSFDVDLFSGALEQGNMLKAGGSTLFLRATIPYSTVPDSVDQPWTKIQRIFDRNSYVVCYCSVYDEHCQQEHLGAEPPSEAVCERW
jgi:hypothetical protein